MITVNGIVITEDQVAAETARHQYAEDPMMSAGHELVLRELLRQRSQQLGLAEPDPELLIQAVLACEVKTPEADEAACRRYYAQHQPQFLAGELVEVEHILFQLTARMNAQALRRRAGEILQDVSRATPQEFATFARQYSNCPSAREGGRLGAVTRGDTVPEFEQVVFAMAGNTLLDRLLETRHGFHIVRTGRKVEGSVVNFETVRADIADWLKEASQRRATAQYLQWLVGQADIKGMEMQGADTPLLQ